MTAISAYVLVLQVKTNILTLPSISQYPVIKELSGGQKSIFFNRTCTILCFTNVAVCEKYASYGRNGTATCFSNKDSETFHTNGEDALAQEFPHMVRYINWRYVKLAWYYKQNY